MIQLTSYDVASTFHQSLGAVAGETCSTAGDCAAGFVCECGVLNPVVAVEIKVTLGGYTSLTFGDTEKGAFRQGLNSSDRETYPERETERFRAAIPAAAAVPAAAVTPANSEPSASEPSPAAVPSLPATSEPRPAVSLPAASLTGSRDAVLWKMSAQGITLWAVARGRRRL